MVFRGNTSCQSRRMALTGIRRDRSGTLSTMTHTDRRVASPFQLEHDEDGRPFRITGPDDQTIAQGPEPIRRVARAPYRCLNRRGPGTISDDSLDFRRAAS